LLRAGGLRNRGKDKKAGLSRRLVRRSSKSDGGSSKSEVGLVTHSFLSPIALATGDGEGGRGNLTPHGSPQHSHVPIHLRIDSRHLPKATTIKNCHT